MKNILAICMLCVFSLTANAQQTFSMGGIVTDEDGALPGVSVHIRGRATMSTSTDGNGAFRIRAQQGDVIVFSFVGYETIEYLVDGENENIIVLMSLSSDQLEEVVITALGTQRRVSVVGAITQVDVAQLQTPATSMSNMLGGRVAGMITTLESGEPGKNISEFWVRGIGTFGASSAALVLIDGLEGDLNSIDPADVESFAILKDASATAVYGVRGANGVVLVTTKRGQSGRLRISARANFAISNINRMPKYLRAYDYASLANEAREVRGETPLYSPAELRIIQYGLDPDLYPDIDWQKETMKRTSFQHTYYMSAQGGGDVARYFVSLNASIQDAAYKVAPENTIRAGVGFNTYNFRMNLDVNLTKNTTLFFGTDGFLSTRMEPGLADTDAIWAAQSMLTPITVPIRYSTGELASYSTEFGGAGYSPYVQLNHTGRQSNQNYTGRQSIAVVHDFSDWVDNLKIRVQGAYDNASLKEERRFQIPDLWLASGRTYRGELIRSRSVDAVSPFYTKYLTQRRKFHLESNITWDRVIATDHRVSALVYYYMSDEANTRHVDEAAVGRASLEALPRRYQGISSRLTYGFRDTYMIDFNFGYTGSENFEPGSQFGFFPSVAVGWVPTQYDWTRDNAPWLSYLKLRASYGTVGSDRIAGLRFPFMTIVGENQAIGWDGGSGSVMIFGVTGGGLGELQFGANDLVWERAIKSNVGIEANFFDNSLTFVVDFFHDLRENIFQRRETIPGYVGLTWDARPFGNVGSMKSYGTDGNVAFAQIINNEWSYTIRANYTFSENEIIYWEELPSRVPYQAREGYPNDAIRGYRAVGLFTDQADVDNSAVQTFGGFRVQPGDIKYKDVNGDGVINSDDMVALSNPTFPRLMYGFGGELSYRNITLGVMFRGTGRVDMYHVGYYHRDYGINGPGYMPFNNGAIGNVLTMVNDPSNRWVPREYAEANGIPVSQAENPNARFPRLSYGYNANNSQLSDFWKNDARYLRLQEVTISYNLRNDNLRRAGISSMDIQLVGNNLYVWDNIKDWDPEQGFRNGRAYPIPSRYALQFFLHF